MTKVEKWIAGWVDVACGLATVITFAAWRPNWDMAFCAWCVLRTAKHRAGE